MKLINRSKWDMKDLLRFLRECFRRGGEDIKEYTIEVENARASRVTGLGSYRRKWIKLFLPIKGRVTSSVGPISDISGDTIVRLAQVVIHESDHTRGLRHRDMLRSYEIDTDWARSFVIRVKQPKPKPTVEDRVRKRYERVLENIERNETRAKRARTALKKLHARRRYYERKFQHKTGPARERVGLDGTDSTG